MPRISRKGGTKPQTAVTTPKKCIWKCAVYARLSVEDSGRKGADTIETQIDLVASYVTQHHDLSLADTYIDNGVSGKNLDRPSWLRLMDDIRAGRVNCVCVKDLSRFSRNYIETCEFLEKIFPFMGVRFVSINDGYDSNSPSSTNEGLIIALKALMHDQHIKDISRKTSTTLQAKRERGEYTAGFAPYGYKKVRGHTGKLEPDEETASIIREIYEWRLSGMGHSSICKRLDERGIPTPSEYIRRKFNVYNSDFYRSTIWRTTTVKRILRSSVYIGTLEQGRKVRRICDPHLPENVPRDQWVVKTNAHEPIVSRELWDAVNAIERGLKNIYPGKKPANSDKENIFKGYVICGICGTKVPRMYNKKIYKSGEIWEQYYFMCPLKSQHHDIFRSIRSDVLYNAVFPLVAERLRSAANLGAIIEKRAKRQSNPSRLLDLEISRTSRELETINLRLAGLYESYVDKLLSELEYVGIKAEYERRGDALRQHIETLSQKSATMSDVTDNRWLKAAKAFQNPTELTKEMIEALVEAVKPSSTTSVEVVWKFKDEYALLEACANFGKDGEQDVDDYCVVS